MTIVEKSRAFAVSAAGRGIKESVTTWAGASLLVLAYLGAKVTWDLSIPLFPIEHVVAAILAGGTVAGLFEYRTSKRRIPDAVAVFASSSFVDCPVCRHHQIRLDEVVCAACEDRNEDTSFLAQVDRDSRMDAVRAIVSTHFVH